MFFRKKNNQLPEFWFAKLDKQVEGWCSKSTASCLWELAQINPQSGSIVEIGSAWGKSTIVLAEASRRVGFAKVYAIDPHTGGIGYLQQMGVKKIDSFPKFQENIKRFKVDDIVIPIVKTSESAFQEWNSSLPIRLLYIDGLHTPEGVEVDIRLWLPLVISGGIIVFDDYFESSLADYRNKIDELLSFTEVILPLKKCDRLVYTYKL